MECNSKDNKRRVEEFYKIFLLNPNITTDTRNINKGDIFFALKGDSFNGNTFAKKALDSGASFAVIDEKEYLLDERCFLVDDALSFLQDVALYHRRQFPQLKLIAITGTNGKTTTKELLYCVLSTKYNTLATKGNFNNHIGVPLTLLRINSKTEIAIIEMGANHIGEINFLCHIAEPNYGLITNIGRAHLEGFGSFENIVKTKTELFVYLDKEDKYPIINMDDSSLKNYSNKHKNKFYQYSLSSSYPKQEGAQISFEGEIIKSKLVGEYNQINILASIIVGNIFNVPLSLSKKAIESYTPTIHRSEKRETKTNTLIVDCYNANPSSMDVALNDFAKNKSKNRYVLLGAMKELGKESREEHKKIVEKVKNMQLKGAFFVGEEYKGLIDEEYLFPNSLLLKEYLKENPIINSTILIKGSNSTKMDILLDVL
jgi:UDP-N-acetylmuramoyl-tripeptide--D-alanyl-D-alanine ligase